MTREMYVQYYHKNYYHNMQYNHRVILSVGKKLKHVILSRIKVFLTKNKINFESETKITYNESISCLILS